MSFSKEERVENMIAGWIKSAENTGLMNQNRFCGKKLNLGPTNAGGKSLRAGTALPAIEAQAAVIRYQQN